MIQNLTLRVIIGVAVGVAAWFLVLHLLLLGGGLDTVELVVVFAAAAAAMVATTIGLGRKPREPTQR